MKYAKHIIILLIMVMLGIVIVGRYNDNQNELNAHKQVIRQLNDSIYGIQLLRQIDSLKIIQLQLQIDSLDTIRVIIQTKYRDKKITIVHASASDVDSIIRAGIRD